MLTKYDVVLVKTGLGLVLEIDGNDALISLPNGNEVKYAISLLYKLDEAILEKLINTNLQDLFGTSVYFRGDDYFKKGKIKSYDFDTKSSSIIVNVDGTYPYVVHLDNKSLIKSECSCPVGKRCKHLAAVLIDLTYQYKKIISIKYTKKFHENTEGIEEWKKIINADPIDKITEGYLSFVNSLKTDNDIYPVFDYFLSNINRVHDLYPKMAVFMYNTRFNKSLMARFLLHYGSKIKNYAYLSVYNILATASKFSLSSCNLADAFYYYVSNGLYEDAFKAFIIKDNSGIILDYFDSYIRLLIKKIGITTAAALYIDTVSANDNDDSTYDDIEYYDDFDDVDDFEFLEHGFEDVFKNNGNQGSFSRLNGDYEKVSNILCQYLDKERFIKFVDDCYKAKIPMWTTLSVLKSFSLENDIRYLAFAAFDDEAVDYFLTNYKVFLAQDFFSFLEFANQLIEICLANKKKRIYKMLGNVTSEDTPYAYVIQNYLDNPEAHTISIKKVSNEVNEEYFKLFNDLTITATFTHNDYYRNYTTEITLSIGLLNLIILERTRTNVKIKLDILDLKNSYDYVFALMNYVSKNDINDVASNEKKYEEEYTKLELERTRRELNNALDSFLSTYDNKVSTGLNNAPIDLEPTIERVLDYHSIRNYLKLRIGTNKYYVVKNIDELLERVKTGAKYAYGKSLEIYHSILGFNESSRRLLELLMSSNIRSNGNEASISNELLYKVIECYKGRNIIYNGISYFVRLDKQEMDVKINSKYILRANLINKYECLRLLNSIILFDRTNKVIDIYEYDSANKDFIDLMFSLNNKDISLIKDRFFDEVLGRVGGKITLDPKIEDTAKSSNLIKLFFDYTNDIVSVKKEYLEDDKLVSKEKASYLFRRKIEIVDGYLSNIGFLNDVLSDENNIEHFFMMDFKYLRQLCDVYLSDRITSLSIEKFNKPTIRFVSNGSSMMTIFQDDIKYDPEDLDKILKALRMKRRFIHLSNDRIINFNDDDYEYYENYEELELDKNQEVELPTYNALRFIGSSNVSADEYISNMYRDITGFKKLNIEVPTINATLRDYQIDGFKWLKTLEKYHLGGILADEMGLGKTLQVIELLSSNTAEKPSLIACPKSLVYNWINEIARFNNQLDVFPIVGPKQSREELISKIDLNKKAIYVISYDSVRLHEHLFDIEFNYVILDEAQFIKNFATQKSTNIRKVNACYRLALTGTPIENNIADLWSIFLFLMPGYFPPLKDFLAKYNGNQKALSMKVAPFILRRTKSEVLNDLPEKYEEIISTEMTEEQEKLYEAFRKKAWDCLDRGDKVFSIFQYLTRLRQVCVAPQMFVENYVGSSGKMEKLFSLIDELESEHKIIIFSQFVKALDIISVELDYRKISYLMITGDTTAKKRIDIVNEFNSSSKIRIILISLKAGGTGLNLTSADTVIHLDPWWNAAVENQATDRAHRIGQTKNVHVIKLVSEGTIEERVIELQTVKKDLFNNIVASGDESITSLKEDDIRFILK